MSPAEVLPVPLADVAVHDPEKPTLDGPSATSKPSDTALHLFAQERELSLNKKLTPFTSPLPTFTAPAQAPLTPDQQTKLLSLLHTVQTSPEFQTLPPSSTSPADAAPTPLSPSERMFLTRQCLLRYLRATKFDLSLAATRLRSTLLWRRSYLPHELTAAAISPENATGKQWILGFDVHGRPCLCLNPARQNTTESPRQVQHLVYMLERAINMMPAGVETLTLVIDFKKSSSSRNPSLSLGKQVLDILQNHYPERLGKAVNVNLPWFVWGFFKIIMPFVDPTTRQKLVYDGDISLHIPKEQLEKRLGGEVDFNYDHEVYWPLLTELCEKRRKEYEARWVELGSKIGESEVLLRGGAEDVD